MSKICPVCKKEFVDEAAFCGECGVALVNEATIPAEPEAVAEPAPQVIQQPAPQSAPQPQYYQPQPQQYYQPVPQPQQVYQQAPEEKKEKLYPAVKTAVYFWLNIAFVIPVVGFILSIILTCAPRNRSLKNFARSYLIGYLIILGIGIVSIVVSLILTGGALGLFDGYYW